VAFRHIQSGIVLLDVPSDWQPMASMGDNISFASHEGESFGIGKVSRLLPEHLRKPGIAGSPSSIPGSRSPLTWRSERHRGQLH
jgi:hypothetical protein